MTGKSFAAALALAALGAAPAAAEISCSPETTQADGRNQNAPPGLLVSAYIDFIFKSDNENPRYLGTNPKLTGVTWSTTEYVPPGEVIGYIEGVADRLFYKNKTEDDLNRMADPPPSPFFVTATVSMENDEGETVTDCEYVFGTGYNRNPVALVPAVLTPADDGPTLKKDTALAPAGTTVSAFASYFFENAGSGAELTGAEFQTEQYYNSAGVSDGILEIAVKSSAELAALPDPPPKPFEVEVTLTMTNSAGETATGTVTYKTEW